MSTSILVEHYVVMCHNCHKGSGIQMKTAFLNGKVYTGDLPLQEAFVFFLDKNFERILWYFSMFII